MSTLAWRIVWEGRSPCEALVFKMLSALAQFRFELNRGTPVYQCRVKATCATDGEDRISSCALLDREEYEKVGKINILKAQSRTRRLVVEENERGPGFSKFEVYGIQSLKFIDRVSSTTNSPAALSGMPAEAAHELAS